jgi:hypothetical protein
MNKNDPAVFHKLYGIRAPKIAYAKHDFLDYVLMVAITAAVAVASFGARHPLSILSVALCAFAVATFITRHGVAFRVPLLLRRPQDALFMVVYKLRNLTPVYLAAVGVLLLENVLIALTPAWPHCWELVRTVAVYLLYVHLIVISAYRTAILVDHLAKKELVREVLMQTQWKRVLSGRTGVTLEIVHAYASGLLTHIILVAPWYLVITHAKFSVLFLPVVCAANVVIHMKWLKAINRWFYRDHWLGHNSELEFLYLHGTHHDAIPSGLIAVAENGFLEGFLRLTVGSPVPFYNPLMSFLAHTIEVQKDIDAHQYIPGVFPKLPRKLVETSQHSTHHYGPIEPYGFGIKVDQPHDPERYKNIFKGLPDELRNSAKLDEELNGFQWENPTYRRTLALYERYQYGQPAPVLNEVQS